MIEIAVTLEVQGKDVPLERIPDKRVVAALRQLAGDVGNKLDGVVCPEHGSGPTRVRLRVSQAGEADIAYEACCSKLRQRVSARVA